MIQGHGPVLADMAVNTLHSRELWLFFAAGWLGCLSYRCWYMAMNMIGVSRAMALNITYALWGILFSVFFMHAPVTARLLAGAGLVFCGVIFVIRSRHEGIALRHAD
ncbi:EamA family transporter [Desulfovibrio sp. 1188_IL3213]|uniref:EamA family transporter n=1 Tax=Desulfovibrio sp. 1188_IL3213 TaxID=3084052 RepID=UPI003FA5F5FE